jgi:hypothetical protein
MAKYQETNNSLAQHRFKEIFGNLSEEEQLRIAISLSNITEVIKL